MPRVDDYCALLGLPPGLVENVTDGTDAHLVAIDADGRLLGSEEDIVDAKRQNRIKDIYLLRDRLSDADLQALQRATQRRTRPGADGAARRASRSTRGSRRRSRRRT